MCCCNKDSIPTEVFACDFYRLQRSCEGYVFTRVCQSFCSWGVCYPNMHCRWYPTMPCNRGVCLGGLLQWVCSQGGAFSRGGCGDPPKADGYCCRWYASYWNAFLWKMYCVFEESLLPSAEMFTIKFHTNRFIANCRWNARLYAYEYNLN